MFVAKASQKRHKWALEATSRLTFFLLELCMYLKNNSICANGNHSSSLGRHKYPWLMCKYYGVTLTTSIKKEGKKKYLSCKIRSKQDKTYDLVSPPGYNPSPLQTHSESTRETDPNHLIIKKSWELALGPLKQVPMNLFIMYMAGNSISIFPIMMVGMLIVRPVKALFTTQNTFKMIEGSHAAWQKIVYLLGNIVCLALALYKCHSMGLLPSHSSDWLAFVEPQARIEYSGGGISLS